MKTLSIAVVLALLAIVATLWFKSNGTNRDLQSSGPTKPPISAVPTKQHSGPPEPIAVPPTSAQPEREPSKLMRGDWTTESELKYQGRANPIAAYESFMWASTGGDVGKTAEMFFFTPAAVKKAEQIFAKLPADKQAAYGTPEKFVATLFIGSAQRPTPQLSYQLVSDEAGVKMLPAALGLPEGVASDPSYHTVQAKQRGPSGKESNPVGVFYSTNDGWKWVIPPSMIDALARRVLSNQSKSNAIPTPP